MKSCKSCDTKIHSNAKRCPTCGRPQTTRSAKIVATLFALLVIVMVAGQFNQEESRTSETSPVTTSKQEPAAPGSQWRYTASEDEMTGKKSYWASVKSDNIVTFGFPYHKPQRATLTLRTHPRHGRDTIFSIERGQLQCKYRGCSVLVRFGDGEPMKFQASEPSSRDSTTLFIRDYSRFAGEMLKVDTVRISVEVWKEGPQVFTFDVHGFDVEKYRPKET